LYTFKGCLLFYPRDLNLETYLILIFLLDEAAGASWNAEAELLEKLPQHILIKCLGKLQRKVEGDLRISELGSRGEKSLSSLVKPAKPVLGEILGCRVKICLGLSSEYAEIFGGHDYVTHTL
jgi:hypothetical protein